MRTSGNPNQLSPCRILLLGLGNVGCRVLTQLRQHGVDLEDVVAVHTDAQALETSGAAQQIQLGVGVAKGLGTGGDAAMGKACAEQECDTFEALFSSYDLVFFIVGLGGGTGNGAGPVLVKLAREAGAFTMCAAVLPFDFEGERRRHIARSGLGALSEWSHCVACFPNERIFELVNPDAGAESSLRQADGFLSTSLARLWKLLRQNGVMNLDFADLLELARHSRGTCSFASAGAEGDDRVEKAIEAIQSHALFERGTVIAKAKALLIGVGGGPDLSLADFRKITTRIAKASTEEVVLFTGFAVDPALLGKVEITVLASETWIDPQRKETAKAIVEKPTLEQPELEFEIEESRPLPTSVTTSGMASKAKEFNLNPEDNDIIEDLDIPTYQRRGLKLSGG